MQLVLTYLKLLRSMLVCCEQSVLETTGYFMLWFSFILVLRSLSRNLTKKSPCSAEILPGLCIWKNQYPCYSPALGGMWLQMTDAQVILLRKCVSFSSHLQGSQSQCIQSLIAQHIKYVNHNALSMLKALNKCFTFYFIPY